MALRKPDFPIRRSRKRRRRSRGHARRRSAVEILESRRLLAVFEVVTGGDAGTDVCSPSACTLRDAVIAANANPGADQIIWAAEVTGLTTLDPQTGSLVITEAISLDGPGPQQMTVQAGSAGAEFRVIEVAEDAGDVSIEGLTLTGGNVPSEAGGGIRFLSSGTLSLVDSVVSGNTAANGGGIYSGSVGRIEITRSSISGNTARFGAGGAIQSFDGDISIAASTIDGNEAYNAGGGILSQNRGAITITDSQVTNNRVSYPGYQGGGVNSGEGDLTITGSTISGNTTAGDGGGIYNYRGVVSIVDTTVSGNQAAYGGGGLLNEIGTVSVSDSTFESNEAVSGFGGGIATDTGNLTLTGSLIRDNESMGDGGGIATFSGEILIFASTLSGNTANFDGGGVASIDGLVSLNNVTLSGNVANIGGGIAAEDAEVQIRNSTVTLNHADNAGGGIGLLANNGGESLLLINSIIAANTASNGPEFNAPADPGSNLQVRHSLIGDHRDTSLAASPFLNDTPSPDADGNLIGGVSQPNIDPGLAPLAFDGGTTPTHALLTDSHAIDRGREDFLLPDVFDADADGNTSEPLPFDQRGAARVVGGEVDMGAFELDPPTVDFGDAPAPYPVLLADNGARHLAGSLRLGSLIDSEADGQPDDLAGGDGVDDDGVDFLADLVSEASDETTSSFEVTVSQTGRLDAWIDFNRDGDWLDAGEQIATSITLLPGSSTVSFTVPAGASVGQTAARFRLSSSGGLTPLGSAADGEVEDYFVTIVDAAVAPEVTVRLPNDRATVSAIASHSSVRESLTDLFGVSVDAVSRIHVVGNDSDQTLTVDRGPGGRLDVFVLDGGGGRNRLALSDRIDTLDLTAGGDLTAVGFQRIDLVGGGDHQVLLDRDAVSALAPQLATVLITGDTGDGVSFLDTASWRVGDPQIIDGRFHRIVTSQSGNEMVQLDLPRPWQNPLEPSDISGDGFVTAGDALRVINELARRAFSDATTKELNDPLTTMPWPGTYYDQNGDGRATALDALRVINRLSRITIGGGEAEVIDATPLLWYDEPWYDEPWYDEHWYDEHWRDERRLLSDPSTAPRIATVGFTAQPAMVDLWHQQVAANDVDVRVDCLANELIGLWNFPE